LATAFLGAAFFTGFALGTTFLAVDLGAAFFAAGAFFTGAGFFAFAAGLFFVGFFCAKCSVLKAAMINKLLKFQNLYSI
jgi:hypothetical protein